MSVSILIILGRLGDASDVASIIQQACVLSRMRCRIGLAALASASGQIASHEDELISSGVKIHVRREQIGIADILVDYDVAIAIDAETVQFAKEGIAEGRLPTKLAYFSSDYELLKFMPGSDRWRLANEAYASASTIHMASSQWLCDVIEVNHGIRPLLVRDSVDGETFYGDVSNSVDTLNVLIPIYLDEPSRGPARAARLVRRLVESDVSARLTTFGFPNTQAARKLLDLPDEVEALGLISRRDEAAALRRAHLLLDTSDYISFGKSVLEAMASGCVPIASVFGGASTFAMNDENCFLVDSRSDANYLEAVNSFISLSGQYQAAMRRQALATAANYSVTAAAISKLAGIENALGITGLDYLKRTHR